MTQKYVNATFSDAPGEGSLPVLEGSLGPAAVDIQTLHARHGLLAYDPGFRSTASCTSARGQGRWQVHDVSGRQSGRHSPGIYLQGYAADGRHRADTCAVAECLQSRPPWLRIFRGLLYSQRSGSPGSIRGVAHSGSRLMWMFNPDYSRRPDQIRVGPCRNYTNVIFRI